MADMERKQYQDQIKKLTEAAQLLLSANAALAEKQKEAEAKAQKLDERIAELETLLGKVSGELKGCRM